MKDLRKDAEENLEELRRALAFVDEKLKQSPPGRLEIITRNSRQYFIHCNTDSKGNLTRNYLSEKDQKLITKLINSNYYLRMRPKLVREIKAFENFLSSYSPAKKDYEYTNMCEARRKFVVPLFSNVTYELQKWLEEGNTEYSNYFESKRFTTDNGEMVRSKSELMIANRLARRSDKLLYKYEPELVFLNGRRLRPDFKTFSLLSGKKSILEHAGMMDNPEYAENFVRKMKDYQENGFHYGENLFVTMETSRIPLTTSVIDRTIERLL